MQKQVEPLRVLENMLVLSGHASPWGEGGTVM